jgi:hypothetical protein
LKIRGEYKSPIKIGQLYYLNIPPNFSSMLYFLFRIFVTSFPTRTTRTVIISGSPNSGMNSTIYPTADIARKSPPLQRKLFTWLFILFYLGIPLIGVDPLKYLFNMSLKSGSPIILTFELKGNSSTNSILLQLTQSTSFEKLLKSVMSLNQ